MSYDEPPQPLGLGLDFWGEPGDPTTWYLDSEDSLLCALCAYNSDDLDEVPQFRPVIEVSVSSLTADDYCAQCSASAPIDEESAYA